jgi:hypothetical protein
MVIAGLFGAGIFFVSSITLAGTVRPVRLDCPLGTGIAKGFEMSSMYINDIGLDGRPYGPHQGTIPPPVCVDNGFVVYKDKFNKSELSRLETYIFSPEYQKIWRSGSPVYYRLAKIYEYLEHPIHTYARLYVLATWSYRDRLSERLQDQTKGGQGYYRREAIQALNLAIDDMSSKRRTYDKRYVEFHYLLVELYRRMGEFESAQKKLDWVKNTDLDTSFIDPVILDYQDYLIAHEDSDGHRASESLKMPSN